MATKQGVGEWPRGNTHKFTWSALANGDDGSPYGNTRLADKTVIVRGTFGAGGTLVMEGSNDGANWFTLNDPQGNILSFTAAKIESILENPQYIRPRVTAGDGTTSLNVEIVATGG